MSVLPVVPRVGEQSARRLPPIQLPRIPHPVTGGTGTRGRITAADREYGRIARRVLDEEHGIHRGGRFELDTVADGSQARMLLIPVATLAVSFTTAAVVFAPLVIAVALLILVAGTGAALTVTHLRRHRPVPAPSSASPGPVQVDVDTPVPGQPEPAATAEPFPVTAVPEDQEVAA